MISIEINAKKHVKMRGEKIALSHSAFCRLCNIFGYEKVMSPILSVK